VTLLTTIKALIGLLVTECTVYYAISVSFRKVWGVLHALLVKSVAEPWSSESFLAI